MDIYTGLIFGVIVILCAAVLASISLFGMKTKTYDEAKAEKKTVVETVKLAQHQKQKKNKKSLKKTKENKEIINKDLKDEIKQTVVDDEDEELVKTETKPVHVEFQEPEIIPIDDDVVQLKKNKKKNAPARPILVNKDENKLSAPPSTSSSTTSLNHFENIHPKDDLEKLKAQLASDPVKSKTVVKPTKAKLEAIVSKDMKVTKAHLSEPVHEQTNMNSQKSQKKKKSELAVLQQLSNDEGGVGINVLEPLLTKAQLSRSELQFLIDLMLNKQHGPTPEHTEWFEGRSDPVQKLKKQLAEKEKALTDEQEKSLGIQAKLRELRTELNAERSRINAATRNYEQTIASKSSEAQQLANKLQIVVESHNAEKHTLTQQLQQYQAKLAEEHNAVTQLQEEQKNVKELMAQRQQYEAHIVQMKENEAMLNSQLHSLHAKLLETKTLQEQLAYRDQQLQEIMPQLEACRQQIADYDQRWVVAQMHENELKMEIHRLQTELRSSKDNLSGFAAMESEMSRLSMLNTKHEEKQKELLRKNEDVDRHINQLKTQINTLQNEKDALVKQVAELSELQNGAATHENNKNKVEFLNLQNALDSNVSKLKQVETENTELKNKVSQLTTTHGSLQSQLDELKLKNDELRTKNWNVMEALQTKEKLVTELTKQQQQPQKIVEVSTKPSEDAVAQAAIELVKRIMPENAVNSKELGSNPEECLDVYKQKIFHMHEQNSQLAAMVTNYKKIVLDTEGVLNNLQSYVETEESRWQEKFAAKEAEIQAMNKQLQAQQKTSTPNHSTNGPTASL
ncbi:ribosome-binding protein 1-like [Ctenocephalides felis]|uniref:ribosome-binding protein 1-like n=1 Tax=Ctenocephalides felis TaxID=7515 RepID=UPI000E6E3C5B|nr:ribosome-binding protein 1-like [Ctenocephalides felis]